MRTSAGCGSTATTRAPSRRNAAMRSPTWAPTSNTRSPARTNWPIEAIHGAAPRAAAVVDAQRADDAAQRPPLVAKRHARAPGRELDRRQSASARHLRRRRGLLRQAAEPDPHQRAAERRRRGDDRERDRQQRPAGDEQRIGDGRRHGQRQQATSADSPSSVCGHNCRAASDHGTWWSSRACAPQPTERPVSSRAMNMVCANHMIGDSSRKKIVSVDDARDEAETAAEGCAAATAASARRSRSRSSAQTT